MKRGWARVRQMRENPMYYLEKSEKEHWSFSKVGEDYFVTEGNHRTILARFLLSLNGLPAIVHGVAITEYYSAPISRCDIVARETIFHKFKVALRFIFRI